MVPNKPIDTEKFSSSLRRRGIDLASKRILITRFDGSQQAEDITLPPNCMGWGRIHHFKRSQCRDWPENPLPIDPALHFLGQSKADSVQVQVFQNAICSWRCWYCFVDFDLLSANTDHADFKSVNELVELYSAEPNCPPIIDLSGGQPDLVPEWVLWFADEIESRGLGREIYLWSDDNLSNDYLWRYLTKNEIERLASYRFYGRVGCFKGFDERSFAFNTSAAPELFSLQFKLMRRLVEAGFDVYGYTTFTSNDDTALTSKMADFIDRLQTEIHPLFPLRTVPLRIFEFTPTKYRMKAEHWRALEIQKEAVQAWSEEIVKRFPSEVLAKPIHEHRLSY